jgi:hypothetical protein
MGAGAGSSEVAPAHLGAAHLPTKAPSSQRDLRPKQGYRKSERIPTVKLAIRPAKLPSS